MTPDSVLSTGQQALELTMILILVLLIPALVTGLVISMFQAATQINEMTLSFIPKLMITIFILMFGGHWMLALITDYTRRLFESIPYQIG